MGQSEGGWTERALLERLDDEVSEWRVGVLLGLDSAGIASDSTGWFQLLDSCRATGTLLLSGDRIHAPALQSELVVLGDKELTDFDDWIVRGLLFGYEHEAENRFDLSFELPVGYVKDHLAIRKNPSPAIREVVEKTFERFLEFETAHATARSLSDDGFNLPYRRGRDGSVEWGKATPVRVADLVRSPCMAGAYLYGRCRLQRSLGARESPGARAGGGYLRKSLSARYESPRAVCCLERVDQGPREAGMGRVRQATRLGPLARISVAGRTCDLRVLQRKDGGDRR